MNPAVAGRIDTKEDMTDTTNGTDGIGRGAPLRLAGPRSRLSASSPVFCVCKWLISRLIPANSAKFHSEKMTGARWCRVVTDSSGLRRVKVPSSKLQRSSKIQIPKIQFPIFGFREAVK